MAKERSCCTQVFAWNNKGPSEPHQVLIASSSPQHGPKVAFVLVRIAYRCANRRYMETVNAST